MQIYLKGYYGYQNFWDELLLFWVIEEIFSRYEVSELIIEVGDSSRIKDWIHKNKSFLQGYYLSRNITIPREKINFFSPEEYFGKPQNGLLKHIPTKWRSYLNILFGKHPFKQAFKIFGGGEVIDESRPFPHNWRNIILLYTKTIFSWKFSLWWGLWSQKYLSTKILTKILVSFASQLILREKNSVKISNKILDKKHNKVSDFHDFSLNLLKYRSSQNKKEEKSDIILVNLAPNLDKQKRNIIKNTIKNEKIIYFPCDLNFDTTITIKETDESSMSLFLRSHHNLEEIFHLFHNSKKGIWSRLHFLYCLKHLNTKYEALSSNNKLIYNLNN